MMLLDMLRRRWDTGAEIELGEEAVRLEDHVDRVPAQHKAIQAYPDTLPLSTAYPDTLPQTILPAPT